MKGFTGTGTNAGNCCTTIDPAAVAAAANYDYVIVYAGMDRRVGGTTAPRTATARARAARRQQGQLISQVAAANPNTIALHGDDRPEDVTAVRADDARDPVELVQRHAQGRVARRRAARHLQPERPHARRPGTSRRPDPERSTDYTIRPAGPDTAAPTCTSTAPSRTRSATA